MRTAPLRVAVWSTGGIGSIAIRAIHRRPDLELVGVWVHTPEKVGKDAGFLANGEPIGLAVTGDADALIDLHPDCIVYAASGPQGDAAAVPDYVRFLEAGINVVSTTSTRAIYPPVYDATWRDPLAEAAKAGGASIYVSGIEPGFALDQLPVVLATQSSSIRRIHSCELGLYDDYPVASVMMDGMGFGRPMDFVPYIAIPGLVLWEAQIRLMADALGVELESVRQTCERAATDRTLEVACGTLEAGTCGAVRIQCIGVVDGRDAIVVEHVTRMAATSHPTGRSASALTYRIEIEGEPNIPCEMELGSTIPPGRHPRDGRWSGRDGGDGDARRERDSLRGRGGPGSPQLARPSADASPPRVRRVRVVLTLRFDMRAPPIGAPTTELYEAAIEMCAWAESRGAVVAVLSEHHGTDDNHLPAPLVLALGHRGANGPLAILLAAVVLPFCDPVRLAEEMSVLDILSKGRVSYVFGIGHRAEEYEHFGIDMRARGKLADEKLALLLELLAGRPVVHGVRHIHVTPAPIRPGGPRILIAGGSIAAARRAGRFGLGLLAQADTPGMKEAYEAECRAHGHEPGPAQFPDPREPTAVFVADDVDTHGTRSAPTCCTTRSPRPRTGTLTKA